MTLRQLPQHLPRCPLSRPACRQPLPPVAAPREAEQGTFGQRVGEPMPLAPAQPESADAPLPIEAEQPLADSPISPTIAISTFGWLALGASAIWLLVFAVLVARLGLAWWRLTRLCRHAVAADDAGKSAGKSRRSSALSRRQSCAARTLPARA